MSCVENGCTAKLVVKPTGKTRKSFHNHQIFIDQEKSLEFRNHCKRKASETILGFREIYDMEILR